MIPSPPGTGMLGVTQGLGHGENPEVNMAWRKPQHGSASSEEEAPGTTAAQPDVRGDGGWRHPRNAPVTCPVPGLPASYAGLLQLLLSPHSRRSLPCGHSHLHKGLWCGLRPTQRQGQTTAAASRLLAKRPSPSLDAVSITLMWASTVQTRANITLMWASTQHGQDMSNHQPQHGQAPSTVVGPWPAQQ